MGNDAGGHAKEKPFTTPDPTREDLIGWPVGANAPRQVVPTPDVCSDARAHGGICMTDDPSKAPN